MVGSSFKTVAPTPTPAPVPPYSMVDITDLDLWAFYYNDDNPFYAIKVVFYGKEYIDNAQPHQCDYIVYYP